MRTNNLLQWFHTHMNETISQLRKTKTLLSVVLLVVAGAALIALGHRIQDATAWYGLLPLTELGGILVGAGILSVWLDAYLSREQNQLEEHRLRSILTEQAPVMRDAVLQAFAANHDDLKRVATPELLDGIISNSLALRLNSAEFAHEIYTDIRDQAIRAAERWHDANLSIQLAPLPMGSGTSKRRPTSSSSPNLFSVTVRWEYTTIPGHQQRRFVCTADRAEYDELANSNDGTTGWYIGPSSNVDAATTEAFELLAFTVDGDQRPIRRSARKHGQTYSVAVGDDAMRAAEPVTISYTYRTTIASNANMLFFSIEQPTRNLNLQFDYSGCGIANVSTLDFVPSIRPTRIERAPAKTHTDTIRVDLDGWIFPRSGVAFVWTLDSAIIPARSGTPR